MARITPEDMIADLDKKIAWFDANPPRDAKTGDIILDPRFIAQVDMLRAMRNFIASKIAHQQHCRAPQGFVCCCVKNDEVASDALI